MVSFFLTLAILLLTVFYQSYGSILQRLFIYLTVSIMAYLAASSTDIQLQPRFFLGAASCKWTGYSKTSTFVVTLMFSCEISIYLLYVMCYQLLQKQLPQPSKSQKVMLELGLLLFATVIPPLLLIIPNNNFGLAGAVCWVKSYEDESCESPRNAVVLQWVIFSMYTVMSIFNLMAFVILVGIFFWLAFKLQRGWMQYLVTARRTILLVLLLILCTGVHLFSILIYLAIVNKESKVHKKWSIFFLCTITPVAQCIQPIAYMFYLNSVKRFHWDSMRSSAGRWKSTGRLCCWRVQKWMAGVSSLNYINVLDNGQSEYLTPALTSSMSMYGTESLVE